MNQNSFVLFNYGLSLTKQCPQSFDEGLATSRWIIDKSYWWEYRRDALSESEWGENWRKAPFDRINVFVFWKSQVRLGSIQVRLWKDNSFGEMLQKKKKKTIPVCVTLGCILPSSPWQECWNSSQAVWCSAACDDGHCCTLHGVQISSGSCLRLCSSQLSFLPPPIPHHLSLISLLLSPAPFLLIHLVDCP